MNLIEKFQTSNMQPERRPAHRNASSEEILSRGWVRHLDWHSEIDSTNSAAKRLLSESQCELPALVVADTQTAGRGRGDHQWWSPSGCLMFTLAIDAHQLPSDAAQWSQLALVCGVAVAKTMSDLLADADRSNGRTGKNVSLKWPNDVYLENKKCAGILIESGPSWAPGASDGSPSAQATWLIGIGINVCVPFEEAPADVARRATSIAMHQPQAADILTVLVELMQHLEVQIVGWKHGTQSWLSSWQDYCLLTGKIVRAQTGAGEQVIGLCEGVDSLGRLIVRHESGVVLLSSAEILDWQ